MVKLKKYSNNVNTILTLKQSYYGICIDCDILEFWAVKTDKTLFIPL